METSKIIVTIGRQTGSGGRAIGRALGEKLGIPFYDKELLTMAAEHSGYREELFENHDEKPASSLLYSLAMGTGSYTGAAGHTEMPLDHKLFLAQFETIRKLADKGPCIIVGRCANYALEEHPGLLSVFIRANKEDRVKRVMEVWGYSERKAADFMIKNDRKRSSYYNYYANSKWGDAASYDMVMNSSVFGVDGCVGILAEAIKRKL